MNTTDKSQRAVRGGGCFNHTPDRLGASIWKLFFSWHQANRDQGFRTFRPARQERTAP